jgi:hypothetical protein
MTECNQTAFPFEAHFSRQVEARFDGAQMTSAGGALLLRAADCKIGLLRRVAACRSSALSLAKNSSMGFKSGEYGGR